MTWHSATVMSLYACSAWVVNCSNIRYYTILLSALVPLVLHHSASRYVPLDRYSDFVRVGYYLFHRPSLCGVYSRAATIWEWRLLIPIAARKAILRETVDWHHWYRRFWPLCWCRRRLNLFWTVCCVPAIENESWGMSTCVQHFRRCGDYSRAATNREGHLIKQIWYLHCR